MTRKKRIAASVLLLLLFTLLASLPVLAAEGSVGETPTEGMLPIPEEQMHEEQSRGEDAAMSLTEEIMAYVTEHASGIVVALSALWAVFPKVGGLAVLIDVFKKIKSYFDDEHNKQSIYNVIAGNADAMSRFMNDVYPMVEEIARGEKTVSACVAELQSSAQEQKKLRAALLACRDATSLMAKEFCDLISISTTVSEKKKAELEGEWMNANKRIEAAVAEIVGESERAYDGETQGVAS